MVYIQRNYVSVGRVHALVQIVCMHHLLIHVLYTYNTIDTVYILRETHSYDALLHCTGISGTSSTYNAYVARDLSLCNNSRSVYKAIGMCKDT